MKKMTKGMLMTALICGAVYLGGSPVYASELQEFSLDEYVVTAARTETKLVDTPANISVVDAQTIEERHYQDVSEVLKDVPGANVLDNGNGINEKKIVLNGDERVLILVDGRRLNFDMGTMTRSGYDMNQLPDVDLIERIEVLKGAGGALYGSDAVGGVVNIITKRADRSYGKVSVGFGSNDSRDLSALYSLKEGKTGVTVSASKNKQGYYKFKDVSTGKTNRWPGNSKYENEKVSIVLEQEFDDNNCLQVNYDYSNMEGFNNWKATDPSQMYIDKTTENISAKYNWNIDNLGTGYIQWYHNELDYFYETQKTEKTNGIDVQQEVNISENNKFIVGGSWRDSNVNNIGTYTERKSVDNIALFINDSWEFAPSWLLNTGIRYDDHSKAGDDTTLSIGLNKKINENSHIYVNWGEVFRTPTTDDYFYNIIASWGESISDPNLKPETGETWTIGYQTKLSDVTDFGINYFESDLDNAIGWDTYYNTTNGKYISEVRNIKNQKKRGMELNVNHKLNNNVDLIASYTYLRVENEEKELLNRDHNYIPNMYRIGINYRDGKWNSNLWLRAASGAETVSKTRYADSRYLTFDLAITYKATKDLSFYAKGYNLFNEAYSEFAGLDNGSYSYPAQSRRFIVGAEYKF